MKSRLDSNKVGEKCLKANVSADYGIKTTVFIYNI